EQRDEGTDKAQRVKRTNEIVLPAGDEERPVRNQHAEEFGVAFTLLTDGVSGAGDKDFAVGLPELEQQFNLLAGARQQMCLGKGQVGDIGQVDRPVSKSSLTRGEGTLVKAGFLPQTGEAFGVGVVGDAVS